MAKKLSGVFAPIGTPFVNQEVEFDQLASNMEKYASSKLSGYFAIGSNGENVAMSDEEKLKVLKIITSKKADNQTVMAGAGFESTRLTIEFCKKLADAGADFVSVLTPCYFKKMITDEAMTKYYLDVADGSPLPVVAYNAPGFTGMSLSTKVLKQIADHDNLRGVKDTSPGQIGSFLITCQGMDFDVLAGTVNTLFPAMMMGATGGIVSLANAFPDVCALFYDKIVAGDIGGAQELHLLLGDLNSKVSGSYGVAGVKYATEVAGFYGGDPRLPLLPLTDADKKNIKDGIESVDLTPYM